MEIKCVVVSGVVVWLVGWLGKLLKVVIHFRPVLVVKVDCVSFGVVIVSVCFVIAGRGTFIAKVCEWDPTMINLCLLQCETNYTFHALQGISQNTSESCKGPFKNLTNMRKVSYVLLNMQHS